VISFYGAYHGGSLATLSASSHHQKFNLPNYQWTILDYPQTNEAEAKTLESFENYLKDHP